MKKIAIGSDPNATVLKNILKSHLLGQGYFVEDFGNDSTELEVVAKTMTLSDSRFVYFAKHFVYKIEALVKEGCSNKSVVKQKQITTTPANQASHSKDTFHNSPHMST